MKWIPDSLVPILVGGSTIVPETETVIYRNDNWVVVQDPKHTQDQFHLTAWYLRDIRSILEITQAICQQFRELTQELQQHNLLVEGFQEFVHFPPNFWRLHVHFVGPNHQAEAPESEVFPVSEVVRYYQQDPNYFTTRVTLPKLSNI